MAADMKTALQAGREHHEAGRLQQAEQIYRQVLSLEPNEPQALFLLGVLAGQCGHHDQAMDLIGRSVAADPNSVEANFNYGIALQSRQLHEQAAGAFRAAIRLKPGFAQAHGNLGLALANLDQIDEAIASYQTAVQLQPNYADAHSNLGAALLKKGSFDQAVTACRRAIELQPRFAAAYNNLGNAFKAQGRYEEAIAAFDRTLVLEPRLAEAHCNRGNALGKLSRFDEAQAACQRAISLNPRIASAHGMLGVILLDQGRFAESLAAFDTAIALEPNLAEAHCNRVGALQELGRPQEALAACLRAIEINPKLAVAQGVLGMLVHDRDQGRIEDAIAANLKALEIEPNMADAHSNLGILYREQGKQAEAMAILNRAIELDPTMASAHMNLAVCLLVQGDLQQGWTEYEWRLKCREQAADRHRLAQPIWDGSDLAGRRILLHTEQGLGDAIQFMRYVPLVAARGGRVMVNGPAALENVLAQTPALDKWISPGQLIPPFDVHTHLMSLPRILGTTIDSIPVQNPPLPAQPILAEKWRGRISSLGQGLKVGLVWAGNPKHKNDRNRSIRLLQLAPLAQANKVRFVSLQKGPGAQQVGNPPPDFSLTDWTADLHDFADTAALIANLDLVICVDTAVTHLAGAMGKPVWTLIPFAPDWRWMLHRSDSPWYPTMRLYRQPTPGDWTTPIAQIAHELAAITH